MFSDSEKCKLSLLGFALNAAVSEEMVLVTYGALKKPIIDGFQHISLFVDTKHLRSCGQSMVADITDNRMSVQQ